MADGSITIDVLMEDGSIKKGIANLKGLEGEAGSARTSIMSMVTAMGLVKVASSAFDVLRNSVAGAISRFDTLNQYPKVMKQMGFSTDDTSKSVAILKKGVDGLPTTLQDLTKSAQSFAILEKSATKGAQTATALNDAFLASGASSEDASRGVEQYSQMLASGTVDLMSWRTLQETMPYALTKVANSFGITGKSAERDLYAKLKAGDITMEQLNERFIELDGGLNGFAETARTATGGIGTSLTNLKNSVTNGLANTLTLVDKLVKSISGKTIAENLNSLKVVINAAFSEINSGMQFLVDHSSEVIQVINQTKRIIELLAPALVAAGAAYIAFQTTLAISSGVSAAIKIVSILIGSLETLEVLMLTLRMDGFAAFGKSLIGVLGGVGPVIAIVVAAVAALAAGFIYLYKTNDTFKNGIDKLVDALKSGLITTLNTVKSALAAINPFLSRVGTSMASFAKAVMQMVSAGWDKFGSTLASIASTLSGVFLSGLRIAGETLSKVGAIMKEMISAVLPVINGLLDEFGGSFGKIGAVLSVVVSILTKVALAYLGISGPIGLATSLVASFLMAWAKTGQFNADGITKVFNNLSNNITSVSNIIAQNIPKIIEVMTTVITSILNAITAAIPQIVEGINVFVNAMAKALSDNLPIVIAGMTKIMLGLVTAITNAIPKITSILITIITTLLTALTAVLPKVIEGGVKIITAIIGGITQAIPQITQAAITIIMGLLNALVSALPIIIDAGLQIIMTLVNAIITALPQITQAGITIITSLLGVIISVVPMILQAGIQIILALVNGVISMIPALLQAALTIILSLLNALIGALPQILNAGIQLLLALVNGLIQVLPTLIQAAITIITSLLGALIRALPQLLNAGIQLITALIQGLIKMLPQIISAAIQLTLALLKALIQAIPQILNAGMQLIQALIRGVLSLIGAVLSAAGRIVLTILNKILELPGKLLSAGANIIQNLINGISNKIGNVASTMGDIVSNIWDSVTNIDLLGAGRAVIDGFVNGLKGAWQEGMDFIGGIGDWIAKHKGPISYDRKLLIPAGKAIMGGFNESLNNSFKSVQSNISNMADSLGNNFHSNLGLPKVSAEYALASGNGYSNPSQFIQNAINNNQSHKTEINVNVAKAVLSSDSDIEEVGNKLAKSIERKTRGNLG